MGSVGKSIGRAYLVGKLQDQGLSRRQSVAVVNVILGRMIHALRRGWEVEFPFGKLTRVKRHFSQWWDAVDDTPANRHLYTVEYELDELGDQELNGWQRPKRGRGRAQKSGK